MIRIILLLLFSSPLYSEPLMDYVERAITADRVTNLTSTSIDVQMCDTCSVEKLKVDENVQFYEGDRSIGMQRALELMTTKSFATVSFFFSRRENLTDRIVFDPASEIPPYPASREESLQ